MENDVRPPLGLGERVDPRWEVLMPLGSGTTSHVYACRHSYGFEAALKVLHPHLATNERRREAFLEQGYLANHVSHPCLVRVFNDGETEDGPYLVMDRVEGESLDAKLRRQGRLPTSLALDVADRLLEFLSFIHGEGLYHRRLNPTEILMEPAGQIRVIDFDSAHGVDGYLHREVSLAPPASRTATYFPPELGGPVASARPAAAPPSPSACDVWAVGAILYRTLTGRPPHAAEVRTPGTLDFVTRREGPPLPEARDDLSVDLAMAVERALSDDPNERYGSADAMRWAIRDAQAVLSVPRVPIYG